MGYFHVHSLCHFLPSWRRFAFPRDLAGLDLRALCIHREDEMDKCGHTQAKRLEPEVRCDRHDGGYIRELICLHQARSCQHSSSEFKVMQVFPAEILRMARIQSLP